MALFDWLSPFSGSDSPGFNSKPSDIWDRFKNGRTNEVNQQIAEENLEFQRQNFEYQKALQQQIFDREDTAYQRTVADMRAAGLSPLSMQSTNGAGEAIATSPMHNDYQHQDEGNLAALQGIFGLASSMADGVTSRDNVTAMTNKAKAEADLTFENVKSEKIDNLFRFGKNVQELRSMGLLNDRQSRELSGLVADQAFNAAHGITQGMTPEERKASLILHGLGLGSSLSATWSGLSDYSNMPGHSFDSISRSGNQYYYDDTGYRYRPDFGYDFEGSDEHIGQFLLAAGLGNAATDVLGSLGDNILDWQKIFQKGFFKPKSK